MTKNELLYLASCCATQWEISSARRCAWWLTWRCPLLIPDQNWPSPCPPRAPGTWSPSARTRGVGWGMGGGGGSVDILNLINNLWQKKILAGHEPCLPWLNTWAGLQRRRFGTWRPRWRRLGSTWWVVPLLRSPRHPGGLYLHCRIAAG